MKDKKFDCVRMKHEIQQEILREMESLSPEEQQRKTEQDIQSDPVLGRLWRHATRIETGVRSQSTGSV